MLKTRVEDIGYAGVAAAFLSNGYRLHEDDARINLFGVRKATHEAGKFDDIIGVLFVENGYKHMLVWDGTTDPGTPNLKNPVNAKGCAILVPGQYKNVYLIGAHAKGRKSEHTAFVQTGDEVSVYRDNDRDNELDMDKGTIQSGYFGINLHRASRYHRLDDVGLYSAGCQVIADPNEFEVLLALGKRKQSPFDYTLFTEQTLFNLG